MASSLSTDIDAGMSSFISEMMSDLESFISHSDRSLPHLWVAISCTMVHLSSWLHNPRYRIVFYRFALNLFEKYHCKNINVIAEVFHLFQELKEEKVNAFMYSRNVVCESSHVLEHRHRRSMVHLFRVRYNALSACSPIDPVRNAFTNGDLKFLETLLRYGISFLPPKDDVCEWTYGTTVVKLFLSSMTILEQKWNFPSTIKKYYPPPTRHRIFMVLLGMEAIARKKREALVAAHIRCLEKIFETIPEPLITSAEIRKFLGRLLNCDKSNPIIYQATCDFEQEYPESTVDYQPRSLKHLSRCSVRQSLREVSTLPHCVDELQLPDHIKTYLKIM